MKVNDIRPDTLHEGKVAAIAEDIAFLAAHRDQFVEVDCPACGQSQRTALYDKVGMSHVRCSACATQYISPRPTPGVLAEFYANSVNYAYWAKFIFPASEPARRERIFRPRAERVAALARDLGLTNGTLLEVGAGYGLFCEEIVSQGVFSRVVGIEPTPDLARICRDKGIEIIESLVEHADIDFTVDLVASFEVIEHLFDPADFLQSCYRIIRPGGYIFLTCPNIDGFDPLVLGRQANCIDHEHLNYFSPASLTTLLERQGFTDITVTTPGQLDVDLVRRAWLSGDTPDGAISPLLERILDEDLPDRATMFQDFLAKAGLSSHMQAIGRRPF